LAARRASARGELRTLADGSLLAVSGIGLQAAESAAQRLADAGAAALVSWGIAGGLDPSLRAGAIVLPSEVIGSDGSRYATAAAWRERQLGALAALASPAGRAAAASGRLLCCVQAIDSSAAKAQAFAATGAVAADMESLAIARIAAERRLPFLAVRVIVDTAGDSLPRAVVRASRGGELRFARLAAGIARAPWEIAGLMRLAGRYRSALASLAAAARAGLPLPPP